MRVQAAEPGSRALLPQWLARLLGFAALAALGALEWQRLVSGLSSGRALLWVLAAVGGAVAVLAVGRPGGRRRSAALVACAPAALLAGYVASGADLYLLKPRHWGELASGVVGGAQALGTVRLPYASADPWPGIALELLGAELLVLAGLLTFWPRSARAAPEERQLRVPGATRGYPFVALAALLVLVASPVVSLGGTRPLVLGIALSTLTVCFLWLERLPLKPGLGVAALLAIALAGALPLAAMADRGEPWFDYRAFAEGLGPDDPVRFSWAQNYGPITWPRDGNEVMRVTSSEPLYWKARDLEVFDGVTWRMRREPTPVERAGDEPWEADVPEQWRNFTGWTSDISVSIRRMRSPSVIGAGTILQVKDASRPVRPGLSAGTWDSVGALRRGDSYSLRVHVPRPTAVLLSQSSSGARGQQEDLVIHVPFKPGRTAPGVFVGDEQRPVYSADVHFRGWNAQGSSFAAYPAANRSELDVDRVMRRSTYARTWELAKRLKRGARSPYDYILRVNAYLSGPRFHYSERPTLPAVGREPLDAFLIDTHEGYCQHFAGAMALLLRMAGIPARVATGFSPGGYSKRHKAWIVRDTDAHAWVEAWFDRWGWVTLDPTPDATPARSQIAAITAPPPTPAPTPAPRQGAGAGSGAQAALGNGVRPALLFDPLRNEPRNRPQNGGGVPSWAWAAGAALALGALALLVLLALVRRSHRPATPMDRAIAELEEALRRVGRPAPIGTTLRQLEHRLGGSPEVVAYLRALSAGRYAAVPPAPPRAGRRALRRALAEGLGPIGRVRALWALPPRF